MTSTTINYPQVNWFFTFNREKYEQLTMQIKSIFTFQDLWDFIQEGYKLPLKDDTKETSRDIWNKNKTM